MLLNCLLVNEYTYTYRLIMAKCQDNEKKVSTKVLQQVVTA